LGGFCVFGSWCNPIRGETPVSERKKANPEFVPKVIDWDGKADFFAFIPQQIEADWDEEFGPLLVGFPLNILFAGITTDAPSGQRSLVNVCYRFDPATFREDSHRKEMCYFKKPPNDYFVRVIFEKSTGQWRTEKFKSKKLISSAFGSTFDKAMIHTTMRGPEPDER
jgi:hypothetical protein